MSRSSIGWEGSRELPSLQVHEVPNAWPSLAHQQPYLGHARLHAMRLAQAHLTSVRVAKRAVLFGTGVTAEVEPVV